MRFAVTTFYAWILLLTLAQGSSLPTTSVVKLYITASHYDYQRPWQPPTVHNRMGSGAILSNERILTSAHLVNNARFIEITKEGDTKTYVGTVEFISHQADLALLSVDDTTFFLGTNPLKLNPKVEHREEVTVFGYPIGGNAISTTKGVVSRIEYTSYIWSGEKLPTVQIDAAINSGNSGGPAINAKGELIGIAMQSLLDSSNIAYIVPSLMIETFLEDTKDNSIDGFHSNSTYFQPMENPSIQSYYNIDKDNGVLVTFADLEDTELQVGDIILSIDGKEIASNGMIDTPLGKMNLAIAFHTKQVGDTVTLKIKRNKEQHTISYTLKYSSPLIRKAFDGRPSYKIVGGLVFAPLTRNFLTELKIDSKAINMLFYQQEKTKALLEPVVMLPTIFAHAINRGYSSSTKIVEKVNGTPIKSFAHFSQLIDSITEEYIVIDLVEKEQVILPTQEAKESFSAIAKIYDLRSDGSAALE